MSDSALAPPAAQQVSALGYTRTAIVLHWLIALLILTGFTIGVNMVDMHISPLKVRLFNYHKWIGITILGLVLIRSVWRLTHAVPPDEPMPNWQRIAAHVTHGMLYGLMIAVPLAGWTYSSAEGYPVVYLSLLPLPNLVPKNAALASVLVDVHVALAWTLAFFVCLHIAGALKHHYLDRDATLRRMLRWHRSGSAVVPRVGREERG